MTSKMKRRESLSIESKDVLVMRASLFATSNFLRGQVPLKGK